MTTTIICLIACFLVGLIIGQVYAYRKCRTQCVNCGSHDTYHQGSGYGSVKGSIANFAVRHFEGHVCRKCDAITVVTMKLSK